MTRKFTVIEGDLSGKPFPDRQVKANFAAAGLQFEPDIDTSNFVVNPEDLGKTVGGVTFPDPNKFDGFLFMRPE